jgi:hypothetical protein
VRGPGQGNVASLASTGEMMPDVEEVECGACNMSFKGKGAHLKQRLQAHLQSNKHQVLPSFSFFFPPSVGPTLIQMGDY